MSDHPAQPSPETAHAPAPSAPMLAQRLHDPLLNCLKAIGKIYHQSLSEEALKAGMPLVAHRFTPALFVRAAEGAGLKAQIIGKPLAKLKNIALPAVLLLKDNEACILLKKNDDGTAQIMDSDVSDSLRTIDLAALQEEYSGYTILVRPAYNFTKRSEELVHIQPGHWFWSTLFQARFVYGEVIVASLLINAFGLAASLFAMNVYDRVVPNHALDTLWVLAVGVLIVYVFEFVIRSLRAYLIDISGKKIDLKLSANIFAQAIGLKMAVRPASVGSFASTVQGYEFFRDFITSSSMTVLVDIPFIFLYIAVIYIIGDNLALIPLIMVPIISLMGYLLQVPLNRVVEQSSKYSAEKQATLIESLSAVETLKTEGAEGIVQRKWEQLIALVSQAGIKLRLIGNLSSNLSVFAQEITSMLIVVAGVYKIVNDQMTLGGLIACSILSGRALAPLPQLATLFTRYRQAMQAMTALDKVMNLPTERPVGKVHLHRPDLGGSVQFNDVKFQYPNQKTVTLENINLTIRAGERVAFLGRIGSGKTTLMKLILGLYQPTSGSILVGATDLQQIDPADLRHNIGYVPQDTMLFYGSIKANITLGAPYVDDATVLRAAKISGVDRFVSIHPDGYDWQVGERGGFLSGGQRRSIAIARALLLNPKILLLDEPTNDMDELTESQLKKNLEPYLEGKTLILMTHKPALLSWVNRLVLMENGHIVADGPKDEILKAVAAGQIKVPSKWSA